MSDKKGSEDNDYTQNEVLLKVLFPEDYSSEEGNEEDYIEDSQPVDESVLECDTCDCDAESQADEDCIVISSDSEYNEPDNEEVIIISDSDETYCSEVECQSDSENESQSLLKKYN